MRGTDGRFAKGTSPGPGRPRKSPKATAAPQTLMADYLLDHRIYENWCNVIDTFGRHQAQRLATHLTAIGKHADAAAAAAALRNHRGMGDSGVDEPTPE